MSLLKRLEGGGVEVTLNVTRPVKNKAEDVVNMIPPDTRWGVHVFTGIVNYYHDVQAIIHHII